MNLTFKENIFTTELEPNPNFFNKFQQLDLIVKTLNMYDENKQFLTKEDSFHVEYDCENQQHLLLHKSLKFNETRAICYLDSNNFPMNKYHTFIVECLKEAWIEYAI